MKQMKYEITEIAHEQYPWLHRIRALTDICWDVHAGDLGGFVESENNLEQNPTDTSWIHDNSIVCGNAFVNNGARLRNGAIAKDNAYITQNALLEGGAICMEDAYVCSAAVSMHGIVAGCGMVIGKDGFSPLVTGNACVYGRVTGNITISGENSVIAHGEELFHPYLQRLTVENGVRSIKLAQPEKLTRSNRHVRIPVFPTLSKAR